MKKVLIILAHAFVLWFLCGMTMMIGIPLLGESTALIVHLIGAPIFAALVSWNYFKRFNYTIPIVTAVIFVSFIIIVDAGLVAPVFEKSYAMFASAIGTWIPFALIFVSTYLTGTYLESDKGE